MGCLYAAVPDPSFGRTACDVPGIYWCQTHNRAASICQSITEAIASEREACAKIVLAEKERLAALVASATIGGRAGKWQGGIDALETTLAAIRSRSND